MLHIHLLYAHITDLNAPNIPPIYSDSDKVDDMMDAMQEERDIHDAISEAISRPAQDMFDDVRLTMYHISYTYILCYIIYYITHLEYIIYH